MGAQVSLWERATHITLLPVPGVPSPPGPRKALQGETGAGQVGRRRQHGLLRTAEPPPQSLRGLRLVLSPSRAPLRLAESSGAALGLAAWPAPRPPPPAASRRPAGCSAGRRAGGRGRWGLRGACGWVPAGGSPRAMAPPALLCALYGGVVAVAVGAGYSEERCSWRGRYSPTGSPRGLIPWGCAGPWGGGCGLCRLPLGMGATRFGTETLTLPFSSPGTLGFRSPRFVDSCWWLGERAGRVGMRAACLTAAHPVRSGLTQEPGSVGQLARLGRFASPWAAPTLARGPASPACCRRGPSKAPKSSRSGWEARWSCGWRRARARPGAGACAGVPASSGSSSCRPPRNPTLAAAWPPSASSCGRTGVQSCLPRPTVVAQMVSAGLGGDAWESWSRILAPLGGNLPVLPLLRGVK